VRRLKRTNSTQKPKSDLRTPAPVLFYLRDVTREVIIRRWDVRYPSLSFLELQSKKHFFFTCVLYLSKRVRVIGKMFPSFLFFAVPFLLLLLWSKNLSTFRSRVLRATELVCAEVESRARDARESNAFLARACVCVWACDRLTPVFSLSRFWSLQ